MQLSKTVIRLAEPGDLSQLLKLYQELRPADPVLSPPTARQQLDLILTNPQQQLVVAQTGEHLTATAMLVLAHNLAYAGRPFALIEHVVTASVCRGQGLAKAVLRYCLELAWQRNCAKVMLLSGKQRPQAHALYQSLGFNGDAERGFVLKAPDLTTERLQ